MCRWCTYNGPLDGGILLCFAGELSKWEWQGKEDDEVKTVLTDLSASATDVNVLFGATEGNSGALEYFGLATKVPVVPHTVLPLCPLTNSPARFLGEPSCVCQYAWRAPAVHCISATRGCRVQLLAHAVHPHLFCPGTDGREGLCSPRCWGFDWDSGIAARNCSLMKTTGTGTCTTKLRSAEPLKVVSSVADTADVRRGVLE